MKDEEKLVLTLEYIHGALTLPQIGLKLREAGYGKFVLNSGNVVSMLGRFLLKAVKEERVKIELCE